MRILIVFLMAILPAQFLAQDDHDHSHGGHDHGHDHGVPAAEQPAVARMIVESASTHYEAVISYGDIHPGEPSHLNVFVSDVNTNAALDSLELNLTMMGNENTPVQLSLKEKGWYEADVVFPGEGEYRFRLEIKGPMGAATLMLKTIGVTHHDHESHADGPAWYANPWVGFLGGALVMLLLFFIAGRLKSRKAVYTSVLLLLYTGQAISPVDAIGQDDGHGHSHDSGQPSGSLTNQFNVPKETQFLFDILTSRISADSFSPSRRILGRVIPAPDGLAEIHSPQVARVTDIMVEVGDKVVKGQSLATLELMPESASQVSLLAALNDANAEYRAAQKEVDRLKSISDIVSKKELDEALSRLEKAESNKKLLENGGRMNYTLKAPIDGTVEPFFVTRGAGVDSGEIIFTISNSRNILIEAQIFGDDIQAIQNAPEFRARRTGELTGDMAIELKSIGQRLNPLNQSRSVIFTLSNPDSKWQIGESVAVFATEQAKGEYGFVPNSAMGEINGKPVVFVKDSAEKFRIVYVSAGRDNGSYTEILEGLEANERVITNGTYQMKMMFLNQ